MTVHICNRRATSIGIDVAKAEVVVAEVSDRQVVGRCRLANTHEALTQYMARQAALGFSGPVMVESTGYYHWPTVQAAQTCGLDIRLVNPALAAKHRRANIRPCKSDPADAEVLAFMGGTEPCLPKTCRLTHAALRLRQLLNLQKQLERLIQSQCAVLNAHAEAACAAAVAASEGLPALRENLAQLRRHHAQLTTEIHACAQAQAQPAHIVALAQLPGISQALATVLAGVLDPQAPSANSWVAFVGLDISVNQSGHHVGRTRLTKRGHAFLRKRLFQAAWGAMMNNAFAKAYYDHLRAAGRPYVESLLMIARKLLRAGYARVHRPNETVDPARLFAFST